MNTIMQLVFGCYLMGIILVALFGLVYATRREYMPYHGAALGVSWPELSPEFRVLILALMRAVGGLCFAIVFLELVLLLGPFRQGAVWTYWAIPGGGVLVTAAAIFGMAHVARHTSATPPWALPIVGGMLFVVGYCLSFTAA